MNNQKNLNYKIRPGTQTDIQSIENLFEHITAQRNKQLEIPEQLTHDHVAFVVNSALQNGLIFVAEDTNQIIGSVLAYAEKAEDIDHILSELSIAVHPEHQRQGIGRALMCHLLHEVQAKHQNIMCVELTVRTSNVHALQLYQSLGFKKEAGQQETDSADPDILMVWDNPTFINTF